MFSLVDSRIFPCVSSIRVFFPQYIGFSFILIEVSSRKSRSQIPDVVCPTRNSAESKRKKYLFNQIDQGFWAVVQPNNKIITFVINWSSGIVYPCFSYCSYIVIPVL